MRFLGTCAADGMPNPFCDCPICQDARLHPERRRLRSMFLLDEENLIDCGPDLNAACSSLGVDLTKLKNVFVTHTHEDHFDPDNAGLIKMARSRSPHAVSVYLSEKAYGMMAKLFPLLQSVVSHLDVLNALSRSMIQIHPVKVGVPFRAGGYNILTVETTHKIGLGERAINYLFEKGGRKLLYACDTGYYTPEAVNILRGSKIDTLILECTWGGLLDKDTSSHMNCEAFLKMLDKFLEAEIIRPDTAIYATHINHKHDLNHNELQAWFDEHARLKVTVAWDGLEIEM